MHVHLKVQSPRFRRHLALRRRKSAFDPGGGAAFDASDAGRDAGKDYTRRTVFRRRFHRAQRQHFRGGKAPLG